MRLKIVISLYCLFSCIMVNAQTSKRSARDYNAAMRYKAAMQDEKACKKMSKAIKEAPASPDAYSQLGEWYFLQHKFTEAALVFRDATLHCTNGRKQFARPFAKSLLYAGLADSALQLINDYSDHKENGEWGKMRKQAYFIKQAYAAAILPQWPTSLSGYVNTPDPELFPSVTNDTTTLYFTRRVNNMDEDLFETNVDSCGGWFSARNMGSPPNTPSQESAQFISADGHYLFFTRCENRSDDGFAEGGCDLFLAYRVSLDASWTIAQPFGATINTTDYEGMPALSPDNRELYFVSDRPGGYGGYDIWISRFEDGLWQEPVNAGPDVNTTGNETAPYISLDNNTLFFTSDGWPGMGGSDIFISRRINDTTWGQATNMGYPINTANEEKSECITSEGNKLYFASDRNGPAGNFDLFQIDLPPSMQPLPTGYVEGYVYDSISKDKLNYAIINVTDAATGKAIYQFQSNRGDGSFTMVLPLGVTYAINTARMGYKVVSDTVLFGKQYAHASLLKNICMLPSDYVAPPNDTLVTILHFDVNRAELSDSDKQIIRRVVSPWLKEQDAITIFVNGYTDNTGNPMLNEELSYKRAGIVADEITAAGFNTATVHSKGWGEARMIASNETEEGQRMNRRVEIVIRH